MQSFFSVICFLLAFKTSEEYLTQKLIIERPSLQSASNVAKVDGFQKMASAGINVDCSEFNAVTPDMYSDKCICSNEEATFSFFEGKWQCADNEDFREREDCGFNFSLENDESPLKVLTTGDKVAIKLWAKNCSINTVSSMYLDCRTWRTIDEMFVMDKFSLNHLMMDNHILKVRSGNFSSFLSGRVIKLGLTCLPLNGEPCLMFKLKGSVSCPFHREDSSPTISPSTLSTSLQTKSSAPLKEIHIKSTTLSYKSTRTVTFSPVVPMVQVTPSFKLLQSVRVPNTPIFQGSSTISGDKISFIASTPTITPTGSVVVISTLGSIVDRNLAISHGIGTSVALMPHRFMTSRSAQRANNTAIMFSSGPPGVESVGINRTSMNGNQSIMLEKMSTTKPSGSTLMKILLEGVIPGTIVGIFVISVSVLLLCLARRMGNMIRVGAGGNEAAGGEERSFSEDATIHGSQENLSVYELVERGNTTDVNENRTSVMNPVYQRDEQLILHDASNVIKPPNNTEVIYTEPFAPIRSDDETDLTGLTDSASLAGAAGFTPPNATPGYQNLVAKSTETVLYASRYSVPGQSAPEESVPGQSVQSPSCECPVQATPKGPNVSAPSSSTAEDLPNTERKDRYKLRDILVEDLEIETCRTEDDLFGEMCIRPSILVCDKREDRETGNKNCENIQPGHVNAITEHFDSMAQSSERLQSQGRNIEPLKSTKCMLHEESTGNKRNSIDRLKTFFKMTL